MQVLILSRFGKLCNSDVLRLLQSCRTFWCTHTLSNKNRERDGLNGETRKYPRAVLSGIQPNGWMHLGNYLGVLRKCKEMQNENESMSFCILDIQSLTFPQQPKVLRENTIQTVATMIACGIDPHRCPIFIQSAVKEHCELGWILSFLANMTRLGDFPRYKERMGSMEDIALGIYSSPVLQAADIMLYKATHVPAGEDQVQHIEFAQYLAESFNSRFGTTFPIPHAIIDEIHISRILSLRDPSKKMSKSDGNPAGTVFLHDKPEVIVEKFKKATTDDGFDVTYDIDGRPGISNLITIHHLVSGTPIAVIAEEANAMHVGKYKLRVADAVVEHLAPIHGKIRAQLDRRDELMNILDAGADKARQTAQATMSEVKKKIGLLHEERRLPVAAPVINEKMKPKTPLLGNRVVPRMEKPKSQASFRPHEVRKFNMMEKVCRMDDLMPFKAIKQKSPANTSLKKLGKVRNSKKSQRLKQDVVKHNAKEATAYAKKEMTEARAKALHSSVTDAVANEEESVDAKDDAQEEAINATSKASLHNAIAMINTRKDPVINNVMENDYSVDSKEFVIVNDKHEATEGIETNYKWGEKYSVVNNVSDTATNETQHAFMNEDKEDDLLAYNVKKEATNVVGAHMVNNLGDTAINTKQNGFMGEQTTYAAEDPVVENANDEFTNVRENAWIDQAENSPVVNDGDEATHETPNAFMKHDKETIYMAKDSVETNDKDEATNETENTCMGHDNEHLLVHKVEDQKEFMSNDKDKESVENNVSDTAINPTRNAFMDSDMETTYAKKDPIGNNDNDRISTGIQNEYIRHAEDSRAEKNVLDVAQKTLLNEDKETTYPIKELVVNKVNNGATNDTPSTYVGQTKEDSVAKKDLIVENVNDRTSTKLQNANFHRAEQRLVVNSFLDLAQKTSMNHQKQTSYRAKEPVVNKFNNRATNAILNAYMSRTKEDSAVKKDPIPNNISDGTSKTVQKAIFRNAEQKPAVNNALDMSRKSFMNHYKEASYGGKESVVNKTNNRETNAILNAYMGRTKEDSVVKKDPILNNISDGTSKTVQKAIFRHAEQKPAVNNALDMSKKSFTNQYNEPSYGAKESVVNKTNNRATSPFLNAYMGRTKEDAAAKKDPSVNNVSDGTTNRIQNASFRNAGQRPVVNNALDVSKNYYKETSYGAKQSDEKKGNNRATNDIVNAYMGRTKEVAAAKKDPIVNNISDGTTNRIQNAYFRHAEERPVVNNALDMSKKSFTNQYKETSYGAKQFEDKKGNNRATNDILNAYMGRSKEASEAKKNPIVNNVNDGTTNRIQNAYFRHAEERPVLNDALNMSKNHYKETSYGAKQSDEKKGNNRATNDIVSAYMGRTKEVAAAKKDPIVNNISDGTTNRIQNAYFRHADERPVVNNALDMSNKSFMNHHKEKSYGAKESVVNKTNNRATSPFPNAYMGRTKEDAAAKKDPIVNNVNDGTTNRIQNAYFRHAEERPLVNNALDMSKNHYKETSYGTKQSDEKKGNNRATNDILNAYMGRTKEDSVAKKDSTINNVNKGSQNAFIRHVPQRPTVNNVSNVAQKTLMHHDQESVVNKVNNGATNAILNSYVVRTKEDSVVSNVRGIATNVKQKTSQNHVQEMSNAKKNPMVVHRVMHATQKAKLNSFSQVPKVNYVKDEPADSKLNPYEFSHNTKQHQITTKRGHPEINARNKAYINQAKQLTNTKNKAAVVNTVKQEVTSEKLYELMRRASQADNSRKDNRKDATKYEDIDSLGHAGSY